MPNVHIDPATEEAHAMLAARMMKTRPRLKATIARISGFPTNDILVSLSYCPFSDADQDCARFVVVVDTCPHEELEVKSNELRDAIVQDLVELQLTDGDAEVWVRFLPGPWCLVRHGAIVDSVSHPRDSETVSG